MASLHTFRVPVSYLPWIAAGVGSAYALYQLWTNRKFIRILLNKEERQRYFANLCSVIAETHNRKTHYEKLHLFGQLKNVKGGIRVLEIGAGSGANLQFYPPNTSLTVIEPNPCSKDILERNLEKYPWVKLENYYTQGVEKIRDFLEAGSFDFVVTTLVGCCLNDPDSLYSAAKYALKPGGKYIFMEHIYQPSWTSPIHYSQLFFDISGVWRVLYDGCHLTRQFNRMVLRQGFANVQQKTFNIEVTKDDYWAWKYVKLHVAGTASTAI